MPPGAKRAATPRGMPPSGWKNRSRSGPSAACSASSGSSAWPTRTRWRRCSTSSAANQQEVTDQLGYQVRKAVEVLIQSLDRADQDHGRELLGSVKETELYEAALTVMMRLVFLFCAEERELLLLGDDLYDQHYAVSTIREQLRATADQYGEEVLERRHDAWCRLLTSFRAVYGGVWHDNFKLPAYGGRLFDPDRFPFLEGRRPGTSWRDTEATPLPVNNRTVLHLLEALQVLQVKVPGGGPAEARRLSFRALDIEQIGHVYEGLLDHTAKRATEPYLGLAGTKDQETEIPLAKLEELQAKGEKDLFKFLKDETGRSEAALKKALKAELDPQQTSRFRTACQGDEALWKRVQPFAGLVRLDTFGYPVVDPHGERVRHAGHRPAQQRHALHAPQPDRTHRAVHAGAAGLRRPRRGEAEGGVEAPLGQGTARPQDLRHGLRLRGVSGPGVPLPVRAAAGSLGGVRAAGAGRTSRDISSRRRTGSRSSSASRRTACLPRADCTSS